MSILALHGANELLRSQVGPKLLLLDEPEAHLHPRLQGELAERLCVLTKPTAISFSWQHTQSKMIETVWENAQTSVQRIDRKSAEPRVSAIVRNGSRNFSRGVTLSLFSSLQLLQNRKIVFAKEKTTPRSSALSVKSTKP